MLKFDIDILDSSADSSQVQVASKVITLVDEDFNNG